MPDLVSIGRFAALSGLTVKALRLYDKRGVLRPALVDFETGRRYYSLAQVAAARQNEHRLRLGPVWTDHDLVFPAANGNPLHPDNLKRDYNRLVKAAGLPRIRIHDLRHTNVTLTLRETADIKAVSQRVGHANVSITLGTYAHVLPAQHVEVTAKVGAVLFAPPAAPAERP